MKLPPFEYSCPTSLSDVIALLAVHGGEAKPLAGGQSLVPMLAFRVASPSLVIDLRKVEELRQITISGQGVTLGAMVRWRDILDDARLRTAHPLLVEAICACRALSDPQSRHRRRQSCACRSRRGNAGHRRHLRCRDRRRQQS